MPVGLSAEVARPSLLDYGGASPETVRSCELDWQGVPADHAIVKFTLVGRFERQVRPKRTWKCLDESACLQWATSEAASPLTSVLSLHDLVARCQQQ